jgi:hypothetical protein
MAYNQKQIIKALEKNNGMVYITAKAVGCSPVTIYSLAKKNPAIQEAINNARGEVTDNAESKLFSAIQAGEAWAICFYLKTQGKGRGYVERQEMSGPEGGPIPVQFLPEPAYEASVDSITKKPKPQ